MKKEAITVFIYGALIALGGIMGHIKVGSTISLALGLIFGCLLLVFGYGIWKKCIASYGWALGLTAALTIIFGYRFIMTGKWMPSGMMLIVSLIVGSLLVMWYPKKKSTS